VGVEYRNTGCSRECGRKLERKQEMKGRRNEGRRQRNGRGTYYKEEGKVLQGRERWKKELQRRVQESTEKKYSDTEGKEC
jgi:hypothetical protein